MVAAVRYPLNTPDQLRTLLVGFRKARKLTQAAMAEKLGITQQSYAQIEANPMASSFERLFRILGLLGVQIEFTTLDPETDNQPMRRDEDTW